VDREIRTGTIWFSDNARHPRQLHGRQGAEGDAVRVYRLDPATGRLTIAVGDMERPNGLAFSPDEIEALCRRHAGLGTRTTQSTTWSTARR
jgi:sugar lactone lactonase YvrE